MTTQTAILKNDGVPVYSLELAGDVPEVIVFCNKAWVRDKTTLGFFYNNATTLRVQQLKYIKPEERK